jgi:hypothetical protein
MFTFYFVVADTSSEIDNSPEYITYHSRYVTTSKSKAEMMMMHWNDCIDNMNWFQKLFHNIKGFRIFEKVIYDYDLLNCGNIYINFRTFEITRNMIIGLDAMKYINVYLTAIYDKGLSHKPRLHKDQFDNKVVTIYE